MIRPIRLEAGLEDGHITLSFVDGPTSFATFIVASTTGEELWEIHPFGMQGSDDATGRFLVTPIATDDEKDAMKLLESVADISDDFNPIHRIVYGRVPEGYAEVAPAKPLIPGVQYRVVLLKVPEYAAFDFIA